MLDKIQYLTATEKDFDELVELRLLAIEPSLKQIGRFDPDRSKNRFRKSFIPENTTILKMNENLVGFYMITISTYEIQLNHLYIDPQFQTKGIGKEIIDRIKSLSIKTNKPIKLEALKGSRSNIFYQSNGFTKIDESEFDNIYLWEKA